MNKRQIGRARDKKQIKNRTPLPGYPGREGFCVLLMIANFFKLVFFEFYENFNLTSDSARQCVDADGSSCGHTDFFTEDVYQQIGAAVYNLWLLLEGIRAVYESQNLYKSLDFV